VVAADVRQRAEAVQLRLEDEIGVVEWLRKAKKPHRVETEHVSEPDRSYQSIKRRRPAPGQSA
jgi:hypothetical protein